MRAFASYIGRCEHYVAGHLSLHIEMPLLYVRPDGFIRNGGHAQREKWNRSACASDVRIARHFKLRCVEGEGSRTFEGFGVAFVAVGVLEENTVAAPNGHLAVTLRVKRESDAWGGIEKVPLHAPRGRGTTHTGVGKAVHRERPAGASTLDNAVEGIAGSRHESACKPSG